MPPLHLVRPAVRAERAYLVPTTTEAGAKVDQNESPFDLPAAMKQAILARFAAEPWNRYPDDRPHALTAALTERLGVPEGSVLVGRGSNDLVHSLGLCFLDAGTPVVIPAPTFALFASVARMHAADVHEVAPEADFSHSADAILAAAQDSGAALTVVVTPNNPTGQTVSYDDLERLAAGVPGILLVDEAYHEFVTGRPAIDLLADHDNVLVMRTFSKAIGLAGIRVGYLVGHPDLIAEMEKARLPFLVDRLAEAVAIEALSAPGPARGPCRDAGRGARPPLRRGQHDAGGRGRPERGQLLPVPDAGRRSAPAPRRARRAHPRHERLPRARRPRRPSRLDARERREPG